MRRNTLLPEKEKGINVLRINISLFGHNTVTNYPLEQQHSAFLRSRIKLRTPDLERGREIRENERIEGEYTPEKKLSHSGNAVL